MQNLINFNELNANQNLINLRMLLRTGESVTIRQAAGSGSGDTADDLAELYGAACEIQKSLNRLIESTIAFLENCSGSMREADENAAAEIAKGAGT